MSVARKIAYNAVINVVAKVTSTVLALVAIGFITRYLGTEGFGKYSIALAFFSFFGAIADLGLYSVATREISRRGARAAYIMGNVFSLRLLISSSVFLLAFLVVLFLPYEQEVKMAILLSSLGFLFSSSYSVLNGIFQKDLAMDRVAMVELGGKVLQVACVVGVVSFNLGFLALMWAFVLNMVFNFVGVYWASRKYLPFALGKDIVFWKKFLKEALPMGISAIVTFVYFKFDTILLSFFQSPDDVGIYSGAYKIIENIVFFPAMLIGLVLPLLSKYIFEDRKKFEFLTNKLFKVFALLVLPLVVGVWFTAQKVMLLVGGEAFLPSGAVLKILIFSLGCIFFAQIFNAVLLVGNEQKKLMYVLGLCAILNISLNFFVIPRYSYTGAAITSVITEFCVVLLSGWLCYKYIQYTPYIREMKKILLSVAIMGVFLYLFSDTMSFFMVVPLAVAIYMVSILFTKALQQKEIMSIFFGAAK